MVRSRRPASLARSRSSYHNLQKPSPRKPGLRGFVLVVGGVFGAGLAWSLLPQAPGLPLEALQALPLRLSEGWIARAPAAPRPGDVVLGSPQLPDLLEQLKLADQNWRPRAVPLAGGGFRYLYLRRADDPLLTIDQIKQRILNPPAFERELQAIAALVPALEGVGVRLLLGPPIRQGATAEWDPAGRTIRIQPAVVKSGSLEFARVLNHEAIHVAQSCRRGSPSASPRLLGLSNNLDPQGQRHLDDPLYARASALERSLEREAYANQQRLDLALSLLESECPQRR